MADNGQEAIRVMRQLGEKALEDKFANLVQEGLKLRAGVEQSDLVDRQAAFVNKTKD